MSDLADLRDAPDLRFDLSACALRITMEAMEEMALERFPGSSLRGALFEALLRRFCMNREARSCADCPLNGGCPVAGLVAPLRDERPRGRDAPRPFVIAVEPVEAREAVEAAGAVGQPQGQAGGQAGGVHGETRLHAGEVFTFAVTLFGRATSYFPYLALSLRLIEDLGMGRPLREHHGRRGRPRIVRMEACQPFTGKRETLFDAAADSEAPQRDASGSRAVRKPTLVITPEMVAARAATLPRDRLTLRFTTPMRLVSGGRLLGRPDARVLTLRLLERLEALEQEYGAGGDVAGLTHARRQERYLVVERLARTVEVVEDRTHWVDVASYSTRQQRSLPISGFVGQATIAGDLAPLRELLVWGELAHAGKNAVKGDGCFHLVSADEDVEEQVDASASAMVAVN